MKFVSILLGKIVLFRYMSLAGIFQLADAYYKHLKDLRSYTRHRIKIKTFSVISFIYFSIFFPSSSSFFYKSYTI